MGTILICIGLFLIYLSETLWVIMEAQKDRKEMKFLDYLICFIPAVRTIYLLIEVE